MNTLVPFHVIVDEDNFSGGPKKTAFLKDVSQKVFMFLFVTELENLGVF